MRAWLRHALALPEEWGYAPKLWATEQGFELALLYLTVAAAFGFAGPDRYSIDAVLGWSWTQHRAWGVAAVLVGVATATATLVRRARPSGMRSRPEP